MLFLLLLHKYEILEIIEYVFPVPAPASTRTLCHFLTEGIELTPEEHNEYLAYKMVLEQEKLTEKEKKGNL